MIKVCENCKTCVKVSDHNKNCPHCGEEIKQGGNHGNEKEIV